MKAYLFELQNRLDTDLINLEDTLVNDFSIEKIIRLYKKQYVIIEAMKLILELNELGYNEKEVDKKIAKFTRKYIGKNEL